MRIGETKEDGEVKGDQPVTISAPPAAAVTIDPQNPLPEPSFFWRRILTLIVCIASLGLAWHNAEALHQLGRSDDLLIFAKWCIGLNALVLTYFFIAPSASELTNMVQSARIIQSSLKMAANADDNASKANESADIRAENRAERRFERSEAADNRFSETASDGAENGSYVDLTDSGEEDFAPRGRDDGAT